MASAFDPTDPPFDRLTEEEAGALEAALDIGYFRPGETIVAQGRPADALCVVIKGAVEERDGDETVALLGPKDCFDSRALVQGQAAHGFVAREETLCHMLPRAVALRLIRDNPRFAAFFYLELSQKLDALAREQEAGSAGTLMQARVADLRLHPASFVTADTTIEQAGQHMRAIHTNALFVRDGARTGVITGMNLSKAVVLNRLPISAPVGPLAHYDVVSVRPDDFVYAALILMTKTDKRRVAVHDGTDYVGFLEDIELLSFLSGNAQLVAGRIDRAAALPDLAAAARQIEEQVRLLRRQGVKVEVIAEIVSDLNRRLFARTFALTAPAEIQAQGCLIVMGSEGRGEQTMRTDQDNALILRAPVDPAAIDAFRRDFTAALEGFGFPPCPGEVMVRNPLWSQTLDEYHAAFRRWVALPDETAHMNVAIFYDATSVAGDASLLEAAKAALIETVGGGAAAGRSGAYMAHFARATEAFPMPIGFFNNLLTPDGQGDAVDLKKGGIFPVVHGVRSLALERGLTETGTAARIERLAERGVFSHAFARDLTQSLFLLMTMRLDAQLGAIKGALVRPADLSSVERDLLREAFHVVKQFREIVRRHFNLGMF